METTYSVEGANMVYDDRTENVRNFVGFNGIK